ncbi:MAG: 50S ribosomal protein L9 [Chloroflexi bacterium]|nr:50S ribosomal protein L9 [Chloroflexota bacterium]
MKVLLKKDVDHLGYTGEVFEVAPGFGRNFLIPRGLAVPATTSELKQAKVWMEQAAARREQLRKEFSALTDRLNKSTVLFVAKAGDSGKLYGSITAADIADKLNQTLSIDVDRRKIEVDGKSLRQVGNHTVVVRLDKEFQARLKVSITAEGVQAPQKETAVEAVEATTEETEA